MPAKNVSVNLLGEDNLENTPVGRIIAWATTYGRYIMVMTEIAVLLAFISRFSLDRKLTDLKEEIAQKQAVIEANQPFEKEFRGLQDQLTKVRALLTEQLHPERVLGVFQTYMPPDIYFENFNITENIVSVNAIAGTTEGFASFLLNLQGSPELTNIQIGDIKKEPFKGVQFQFTAELISKRKKAVKP